MKKEKGKVKSEKGTAKMTAEQKACLAAMKSFDADLERAKEISVLADCVLREMCKSCGQVKACENHLYGLPKINCRTTAIASVAVGMILEAKGGAK